MGDDCLQEDQLVYGAFYPDSSPQIQVHFFFNTWSGLRKNIIKSINLCCSIFRDSTENKFHIGLFSNKHLHIYYTHTTHKHAYIQYINIYVQYLVNVTVRVRINNDTTNLS